MLPRSSASYRATDQLQRAELPRIFRPPLAPDEQRPDGVVRLWTVDIGSLGEDSDRLLALLAPDERDRAGGMASAAASRRFVAARAAMRAVLGAETGAEPESLRLEYGDRGKPRLTGEGELRFNVSHSGGLALVALARGREVGVDVERIRPRARLDGIARRSFSTAEVEALARGGEEHRLERFYAVWTAREAFVKATGRGLGAAPESFSTPPPSEGRDEPAPIVEGGREESRFSLVRLAPAPGYSAAVVASGSGWRLERRALPGALAAP